MWVQELWGFATPQIYKPELKVRIKKLPRIAQGVLSDKKLPNESATLCLINRVAVASVMRQLVT